MRQTPLLILTGLLLLADRATAAAIETLPPVLVSGQSLILPKRPVPDDPLAGLPTGAGDRNDHDRRGKTCNKGARAHCLAGGHHHRGKIGNKGTRVCRLNTRPADSREVGDLRATLAFVLQGPEAWPCPSHQGRNAKIRLRILVDDTGKITDVQQAGGDASVTADLAKRLIGRSIAPRSEGPTEGTVVLRFAANRR
ncbi:MAG TPA: hypothetical protein VF524_12380 [Polyangia bacterium]